MAGVTNRGKFNILSHVFRTLALPSNFYVFLVSDTPTQDTNTLSQLTEITETGREVELDLNGTDFDTVTEDDGADKAIIQIKDCAYAGPITSALYAVLVDGNAGGDDVYAYWSLGGAKSVSSGQTLTLQDLEIDLLES